MLDAAPLIRVVPTPQLPIEEVVVGKSVEEAAAVLPRVFNLCRAAQGLAARAAFGLPLDDNWKDALRSEILREHVVKLCLKWPALLSLPAIALPRDWQANSDALRIAIFGMQGSLPETADGFESWLSSDASVSPVMRGIRDVFAPGEAARADLPLVQTVDLFGPIQQENSAAARHADHPVMRTIETRFGRGPLWSAMGVAFDVEAVLDRHVPTCKVQSGRAVVPAARGFYGVRARVENGHVLAFERVTPTDHMLAPGGALDQAVNSLPPQRAGALSPLLLSVMDPCFPVKLEVAKGLTDA